MPPRCVIDPTCRYTNYVTTPIADVTFTVPTSDPTFGVCKQCGKDPACDMDYCTS